MKVYYDKNGYPICKGDLIRSFHFTGRRRKRHYLYHVAVEEEGGIRLVPTMYMDPSFRRTGGDFLLRDWSNSEEMTIIHGHGPEPYLSFEDRPRRKHENNATTRHKTVRSDS